MNKFFTQFSYKQLNISLNFLVHPLKLIETKSIYYFQTSLQKLVQSFKLIKSAW